MDRTVIDFEISPEVVEIRDRTREFIRDVVIPQESKDVGEHGLEDGLRDELQDSARKAGVFAPHAPVEYGGLGLDHRGVAIAFEEAGYSLLGPQAVNGAAPDEGNMMMLSRIASEEQKLRYMEPLMRGEIRSCFAMTEPAPGAGSDPTMLRTRAERVDGGWSISGEKWFITGAEGASFTIVMALTGDQISAGEGATMFLVDKDNPGMAIERVVGAGDRSFPGGHAQMRFRDCVVGDEAVLGEVGKGFQYAQVRLGPARLTHCMRWLGLARRALDIAIDRAESREAFGSKLAGLGMIQEKIADAAIDIETSRLLIWKCAWALDRGDTAKLESSIAKAHTAEAVYRVVDTAIQICGSLGVSGDLPLSRYLNEVRPFRIYDGPTETHKWAIARRVTKARSAGTA